MQESLVYDSILKAIENLGDWKLAVEPKGLLTDSTIFEGVIADTEH